MFALEATLPRFGGLQIKYHPVMLPLKGKALCKIILYTFGFGSLHVFFAGSYCRADRSTLWSTCHMHRCQQISRRHCRRRCRLCCRHLSLSSSSSSSSKHLLWYLPLNFDIKWWWLGRPEFSSVLSKNVSVRFYVRACTHAHSRAYSCVCVCASASAYVRVQVCAIMCV